MRNLTLSVLALSLTTAGTLAAQTKLVPAPSGRATSVVTLTVPREQGAPAPAQPAQPVTIKLDYGQPHLRGRTLHKDTTLVPYDRPWRTGANDATKLTTGVDLVIGGTTVPAGEYVLYTIPTRGDWKLILQKSAGQTAEYDQSKDFARIDMKRRNLSEPVESLTMWLIPASGKPEGELYIAWGNTAVTTGWTVK